MTEKERKPRKRKEVNVIMSWSGELNVEKYHKVLLEVYDAYEKRQMEEEKKDSE